MRAANCYIEPGHFYGGELEGGTFHGGKIEGGTFHHFVRDVYEREMAKHPDVPEPMIPPVVNAAEVPAKDNVSESPPVSAPAK